MRDEVTMEEWLSKRQPCIPSRPPITAPFPQHQDTNLTIHHQDGVRSLWNILQSPRTHLPSYQDSEHPAFLGVWDAQALPFSSAMLDDSQLTGQAVLGLSFSTSSRGVDVEYRRFWTNIGARRERDMEATEGQLKEMKKGTNHELKT